MFVFSMDCSSTWPKISEMAWHLFPNLQGVTWPWVKVEIFFSKKKTKSLVELEKNFDSDQLLTVNLGSIQMSVGDTGYHILINQRVKIVKIKVVGLYLLLLEFLKFFHKKRLFLRILNRIFWTNDIFQR